MDKFLWGQQRYQSRSHLLPDSDSAVHGVLASTLFRSHLYIQLLTGSDIQLLAVDQDESLRNQSVCMHAFLAVFAGWKLYTA